MEEPLTHDSTQLDEATTAQETLRAGRQLDPAGYRKVVPGRGEPHCLRMDLAQGRARHLARSNGTPLLTFVQLSDLHVTDHQSPARFELIDRYSDPEPPRPNRLGRIGSYRPQELMSTHVVDAMVIAVNRLHTTLRKHGGIAFTIITGDVTDNCQYNEVRMAINALDGGWVQPDSGKLGEYEGIADDHPFDPWYWHPEKTARDIRRLRSGFPEVPGLLEQVLRPFEATGLDMPWYTALGNHDGLLKGSFAFTPELLDLPLLGIKAISPGAQSDPEKVHLLFHAFDPEVVTASYHGAVWRDVTPDADRRLVSKLEYVDEHFVTRGLPVGHGFTDRNRRDGTAWYRFDSGVVRCVVLDTVNADGGGWHGSIDEDQFSWFKRACQEAHDRPIVVFSHHTSDTMTNSFRRPGAPRRVLGEEFCRELLHTDNVVLWVNGHMHTHRVRLLGRPDRGVWEVTTGSHIDWPQQGRLFQIIDNHDGTCSVRTTMFDTAAPLENDGAGTPLSLAALSRELSLNNWQTRPSDQFHGGSPSDRNCELVIPIGTG